ncbi:unnamed protein product, partial [Meganyctiphanes norvegica]
MPPPPGQQSRTGNAYYSQSTGHHQDNNHVLGIHSTDTMYHKVFSLLGVVAVCSCYADHRTDADPHGIYAYHGGYFPYRGYYGYRGKRSADPTPDPEPIANTDRNSVYAHYHWYQPYN